MRQSTRIPFVAPESHSGAPTNRDSRAFPIGWAREQALRPLQFERPQAMGNIQEKDHETIEETGRNRRRVLFDPAPAR